MQSVLRKTYYMLLYYCYLSKFLDFFKFNLWRENMLEVIDFSKQYRGAKVYSAKNISFKVGDGEVVGLVGGNGAGKSTTIKSIVGILPINEGQIVVNGFDVAKDAAKAKQIMGYVPDDHSVYEKLTGREYVDYMGSLFGVSREDKKNRLEYYSSIFEIGHALDNQISSYSHGMKQKICLIGSLIHQPKLWVLDEPMMGLDPTTMNEVKKCIRDYANKGNSVLFSSHNLDIVEKVCDAVGIINKGHLAAFINLKEAQKDPKFDLEKTFMNITKGAK